MPSDSSTPPLKDADWLGAAGTQRIFSAVEQAGYQARIVGGAVRNSLLSLPVTDVDFATNATPVALLEIARKNKIKAVPTGMDHGTVTYVVNNTPYELTTLRRDVKTDGRHAQVLFTDDWHEDAQRRDFTMNALYCDSSGHIFDPVNGLEDLRDGLVRFIGDAGARIEEDYLRILRFFRFTASYGRGKCDPDGLAGTMKLRHGLDQLSGERIEKEFSKLLVAPFAGDIIPVMNDAMILQRLFKPAANINRFTALVQLDKALGFAGNYVQRLAALLVTKPKDAVWLRDRLRLSSKVFERLAAIASYPFAKAPPLTQKTAKDYIYTHGTETFRDQLLLTWSETGADPGRPPLAELLSFADHWAIPDFPITGRDVLALGIPPGPRVGAIIEQLEQWWIDQDFTNDSALIRQKLGELVIVNKT